MLAVLLWPCASLPEASARAKSRPQLWLAELLIRRTRFPTFPVGLQIELAVHVALWRTLRGIRSCAQLHALLNLYQPTRGTRTLLDAHELTNGVTLEAASAAAIAF